MWKDRYVDVKFSMLVKAVGQEKELSDAELVNSEIAGSGGSGPHGWVQGL
jgi:hypothetical protein